MRSRTLLTSACALLAGCMTTSVVVPKIQVPTPLVESLPLRVAVYIAPEVQHHKYKDANLGVEYDVGEAQKAAFLFAASATFSSVAALDTEPDKPPPDADALLEFKDVSWWSDSLKAQTLSTSYSLQFLDAAGQRVADWSGDGSAAFIEVGGLELKNNLFNIKATHGAFARLVLERAIAKFLREFRDDPAVHHWLEERNTYRPALPADDNPAVARPAGQLRGVVVYSGPASDGVRRCVESKLKSDAKSVALVSPLLLDRALYPWLSDRPATGIALERLGAVMRYPPAISRLDALNVGRVVIISGGTTKEWHGGGFCGSGPGGGGCLGLAWGDRTSVIAAQIVDRAHLEPPQSIEISKSAHTLMPALFVPLPIVPPTQSAACHEIARKLAEQLAESIASATL